MKRYTVKITDKSGNSKGVLGDLSNYSFSQTINGGLGQLVIRLPRRADDYGDLDFLDDIQIWVQDKDTGNTGVQIYSGYVDEIISTISGNQEDITLNCLGYVARLGYTLDMSGSQVQISRLSQDPAVAVKDVIDKYRALVASPTINYTASSVETAGFNISYVSNSKYCIESIERIRQMAGANWWWSVDASNTFNFKSKPSTPTHAFVFGKDISNLQIRKSVGQVENKLVFWNGQQDKEATPISKIYYSGTSVTNYWDRFSRLTDSRITDSTTADKLGDAYIDSVKEPSMSLSFTVKDNNYGQGYDIESVKVGQTCQILNWKDSDLYSNNLLITGIDYTPEAINVQCEDSRDITGRSLTDIRRELDNTIYGDGATNITSTDVD